MDTTPTRTTGGTRRMMATAVLLFVVATLWTTAAGAGCHGQATYGPPNVLPVANVMSSLKLVNTTTNGKLYVATLPQSGGNTTNTFNIVHVFGTAYEMGFAQGELLHSTIPVFIDTVWSYFEKQVDSVLPNLPQWLQVAIADVGLDLALDATYYATKGYTGQHFWDELRGLCDASGTDYNTAVRVHMIAGLTQGDCSMTGAWGKAVSAQGTLLQMRALDWDMQGPFRDYPQITVYHPTVDGHAFANIGMSGFVGGLTGVSEKQLGISEIGVAFPDSTFGSESRIGTPFIFLLRDILQFDNVLDDAINRMINARRTCDLILGVGDGKSNEFRGFQYSYAHLNVFDDQNMMPLNSSWHPRIDGVVYWGMDWLCPSYNLILSQQLKKFYGKLTPQIGIQYVNAVEKSGDNHVAWYDLTHQQLWVSFAAQFSVGGPSAAYARQFANIDLTKLWSETI